MNNETRKFLEECRKVKLTKVCIKYAHPDVPTSVSWSNGSFGVANSVFSEEKDYQGWPAIWEATRNSGFGVGTGNSNQSQIKHDCPLLEGYYFRSPRSDKWERAFLIF